jgi:hypothetical protein
VSHRFAVPLVILGSAGLAAGFMPALAEAATGTTAHSASTTLHTSAAPKSASAGLRTLHAPTTRSHRLRQAAVGGAAATDPNPNLAVGFTGGDVSALGITADASITGYSTATSGGLSATIAWGDGTTTDYANIGTSPSFSHVYGSTGVYSITVTVSDGAGDAAADTWSGIQTEGSEYTPYPPTRVLDTRKGIGAPAVPLASKGTLKLKVGNPPIPEPYGITAVVLNVTATRATAGGFLSVYGDEDLSGTPVPLPQTSNLNFSANEDVANLVIVPVGSNGVVDFYNGAPGSVGVIADVQGYFSLTEVNKYVSVSPTRILDTRKGTGTGVVKQIPANGNLTLTVTGSGKGIIPATGRTAAVAMNLTVTNPTSVGNITAYPAGESQPTTSNVNYTAHSTVANTAIVPVGTNGQIVFHNNGSGPVDLIADATGYFTADQVTGGSAYVPLTSPARDLDTRPNSLQDGTATPFAPGYVSWASSMVFNATVTKPTTSGYLTLYPYDPATPNALPSTSNLNFGPNQTIPNLAIVPLGTVPDTTFNPPVYEIGIYLNGRGSTQVILDLFGFFADQ